MNVRELRIGNRFEFHGRIFVVSGINSDGKNRDRIWSKESTIAFDPKECNEIPISTELLKRAGFYEDTKSPHGGSYYSMGIDDYKYCIDYADFRGGWDLHIEYTDSPNPRDGGEKYPIMWNIKGWHHLQNVWFVLTGMELPW